jgi:4-aminobutyrate aminotransferase-like enzyme/Ser/Thr protein kinase RdoA (MazF antagonist)
MATTLSAWLTANHDTLQTLLGSAYGITGKLHGLVGELDLNLRVESGEQRYLLKVMRRDCDVALVDMQCHALEALAVRLPRPPLGVPVQRVIRTRTGAATTMLVDGEGHERLAWLLSYLPGRVMGETRPAGLNRPPALLGQIGAALGQVDAALQDFQHTAVERAFKWDLRRAGWIADACDAIEDSGRRALVSRIADRFVRDLSPRLEAARRGVIHGDANDYNLLVAYDGERQRLTGLLDFGDMCRTALVGEPAIAAAYAMMGKAEPFAAAEALVAGYHRAFPLQDDELALLFPLILTRLAVSVVNSALAKRARPDDPYVTISEAPAWRLLEQLHDYDPRLAEARLRAACGRDPWPKSTRVLAWLAARRGAFAEILGPDRPAAAGVVLDLSFASTLGGDDPEQFDADVCGARVDAVLHPDGADPKMAAKASLRGPSFGPKQSPLLTEIASGQTPPLAMTFPALGIGRYGEPRPINAGPVFGGGGDPLAVRRTRHIAVDLFAPAGMAVHAPLAGQIAHARWVPDRFDYGGLIILRHHTDDGDEFETLYGHLSRASVEALAPGQSIAAGEAFALLGERHENGGWPPHVHIQLLVEDTSPPGDTPQGSVSPGEYVARSALNPCPAALLNLPDEMVCWQAPSLQAVQARRGARSAANLKLSYTEPFHPVRGWRHLLYDAEGRAYLDAYNNVPHVGHCHPRVVAAAAQQMCLLSTNTRYLYDSWLNYADRLVARLPAPLSVCFFVNSGSEANELALRLARGHTGAKDMLVMDHGYHGNTTGAMDISPYKFNRPGGPGAPDWVHVTPLPDVYRGVYRVEPVANRPDTAATSGAVGHTVGDADVCPPGETNDEETAWTRGFSRSGWQRQKPAEASKPERGTTVFWTTERAAGARYAALVRAEIEAVQAQGRGVAGYISECLPSVGGQIVLPEGFLAAVYRDVRQAGGVCIADDVQTALGRTGTHFWGFELQDVVPDVLVLGKPLGNGHPLAAVVTTPAIAASFAAGPEFFSTFGGNSVSCAVGAAVLDVLEEAGLQAHALRVGEMLLAGLRELAQRHPLIGDVRGTGLFIGVELVTDRGTREPATRQASYVKDRMRELRVLLGTEGPHDNVLKVRPPMTFDAAAASRLLETLDEVLGEDLAQPAA